MSTGHGNVAAGESVSATTVAFEVSPTAVAVGTAPGCQVTVAAASAVTTAPAAPCCAVSVPTTAGGIAACATAPVFAVAVIDTTRACPMFAAMGVYVSPVAPGIGAQFAPAASHCCHWYVNETGFPPPQVPGTAASFAPARDGPTIDGRVAGAGT